MARKITKPVAIVPDPVEEKNITREANAYRTPAEVTDVNISADPARVNSREKSTSSRKYLLPVGLAFAVLLLVGISFYFYREASLIRNDPQRASQEEVRKLLERVGELMVLPQDEEPTVATVTDPEQLKNQSFFTNAKKGDKVLIYTVAKRAILYDPVAHKIIDIAPLNIPDSQTSTSTAIKKR